MEQQVFPINTYPSHLFVKYYKIRTYRRLCQTLTAICFMFCIVLSINTFVCNHENWKFGSSVLNNYSLKTKFTLMKQFSDKKETPHRYVIELNKTNTDGVRLRLQSNINVRRRFDLKIGIFIAILSRDQFNRYRIALNSIECYAAYHRYQLEIIYESDVPQLKAKCSIDDWMFRRHCLASLSLSKYDWMLFVDADVGVINPTHLIEEWIDERVNIIFYDRLWNHEVMTGGYLIRNTEYSNNFLRNFAEFSNELPKERPTGSDNGAIHYYLVKVLTPHATEKMKFCYKIYQHSQNIDDLFVYEACCRTILGENRLWPDRVKLLARGEGWARDFGVTNSLWSNRDFMLHGWKEESFIDYQNRTGIDIRPINGALNIDECADRMQGVWKYNEYLINTDDVINKKLLEYEIGTTEGFWHHLVKIQNFFNQT